MRLENWLLAADAVTPSQNYQYRLLHAIREIDLAVNVVLDEGESANSERRIFHLMKAYAHLSKPMYLPRDGMTEEEKGAQMAEQFLSFPKIHLSGITWGKMCIILKKRSFDELANSGDNGWVNPELLSSLASVISGLLQNHADFS